MSEFYSGEEQGANESYVSESPELTYTDQAPSATGEQQSDGTNPAWAEYLEEIPDGFKGIVGDAFKKWDSNVTNRFQQLHEQYKPYEAYKPFIERQVDPQVLEAGALLFQRLQTDPQGFYEQLGEAFGLSPQQVQEEVQQQQQQGQEFEAQQYEDPRFQQLEQAQQAMFQMWQQKEHREVQQQADTEVKQEYQAFRQAHPEVQDSDMRPIMRILMMGAQQNRGYGFDDAYKQYVSELNDHIKGRPGNSAPRVISTSGQPGSSSNAKFEDLDEDQRKAVLVQELKGAFS